MINVTVGELFDSSTALQKIATQPFSGGNAFKIARLLKAVDEEMKTVEETRRKIVTTYCEKDDNGEPKVDENGQVHIANDVLEKCNEELNSLFSTSVELNVNKISIDALETVELSPMEVMQVEMYFE